MDGLHSSQESCITQITLLCEENLTTSLNGLDDSVSSADADDAVDSAVGDPIRASSKRQREDDSSQGAMRSERVYY